MNSTSLHASHLSKFNLNYGFHPTEADIYAHFSPAQYRLEHVYDYLQRLVFTVPDHKSRATDYENAKGPSYLAFRHRSW